jgi:hypothetical protein
MNRPMRSRIQGGVGGWRLDTSGYPIMCFEFMENLFFTNGRQQLHYLQGLFVLMFE